MQSQSGRPMSMTLERGPYRPAERPNWHEEPVDGLRRQLPVARVQSAVLAVASALVVACGCATPPSTPLSATTPNVPIPSSSRVDKSTSSSQGAAWWMRAGVSACGIPVVYRVDVGPMVNVGDCAAMLGTAAQAASMHVGQRL